MEPARYVVDPDDPRAPSQEVWDRASEQERRRIVESLPSEIERALPPEGDVHRRAKNRALEALEEFYRRTRRRIYLSSELPVYSPGEAMFAPDLIAVLDVEDHDRMSWVVSAEGKGLDFALEIRTISAESGVGRSARSSASERSGPGGGGGAADPVSSGQEGFAGPGF